MLVQGGSSACLFGLGLERLSVRARRSNQKPSGLHRAWDLSPPSSSPGFHGRKQIKIKRNLDKARHDPSERDRARKETINYTQVRLPYHPLSWRFSNAFKQRQQRDLWRAIG